MTCLLHVMYLCEEITFSIFFSLVSTKFNTKVKLLLPYINTAILVLPLAVHPWVGFDCCIVMQTLLPVAEQYMFTLHQYCMIFVICFPSYIPVKSYCNSMLVPHRSQGYSLSCLSTWWCPTSKNYMCFIVRDLWNLVLLEGAGRASGDMFLKYHRQTLWRRYHRQADGQIDMDLEKVKAPSPCLHEFPVSHHSVICHSSYYTRVHNWALFHRTLLNLA